MAHELRNTKEDLSLGELFADLSRETSTLVRQEVTLAKTEISEKVSSAGKDVGYVVAGGVLAHIGLLAIVAAVIVGLAALMPLWASALLVGLVLAGIGGGLAMKGMNNLKAVNPVPNETVESLKEDAKWAKEQTR